MRRTGSEGEQRDGQDGEREARQHGAGDEHEDEAEGGDNDGAQRHGDALCACAFHQPRILRANSGLTYGQGMARGEIVEVRQFSAPYKNYPASYMPKAVLSMSATTHVEHSSDRAVYAQSMCRWKGFNVSSTGPKHGMSILASSWPPVRTSDRRFISSPVRIRSKKPAMAHVKLLGLRGLEKGTNLVRAEIYCCVRGCQQ